ncbi:MAG: helix-turn-helix transcriptional regulator [Methylobacterium mesophilicum]|nr:helix-turn-helix transcriptional regulator [Methylobacterium mesophilicum]
MIQRSGLLDALTPLLTKDVLPDAAVGTAFGETMAALAGFDFTVVFAYRGQERPIDLYSTFPSADYEIFVSRYQAGPYLLDPFFHAARRRIGGVFRMRELAPDRFFSSEYFRTYYGETRLAEEIGFFVPIENGVTVVLSLMRRQQTRAFPAREFALLKDAEPFVAALVKRFWSDLDLRFDEAHAKQKRKGSPIHAQHGIWQRLGLTGREAAIVELVLQGHSSEAVGERLGIATGTVKVHRRNVYRKLGIASQTQLLSLYLRTM